MLIGETGWHFKVTEKVRSGNYEVETSYGAFVASKAIKVTGSMGDFLIDIPSRKIYMTDSARKVYTVVDLDEWTEAARNLQEAMARDTMAEIKVVRTQEFDSLLGGRAIKYQAYINGKPEQTIWVRDDLQLNEFLTFESLMQKVLGRSFIRDKIERELRKQTKGLIVKTVSKAPTGELYVSEIKEIEKRDFKESDFRPPRGYKKVSPEVFFKLKGVE